MFFIPVGKGDCSRLLNQGLALIDKGGPDYTTEGLKMLLSVYSLTVTDPGADQTAWNIARAFANLGETDKAYYYYSLIRECYPQSRFYSQLKNTTGATRSPPIIKEKSFTLSTSSNDSKAVRGAYGEDEGPLVSREIHVF